MISNADMFVLDLEVYDIPATYNDEADFLDDDWSMNIHTYNGCSFSAIVTATTRYGNASIATPTTYAATAIAY